MNYRPSKYVPESELGTCFCVSLEKIGSLPEYFKSKMDIYNIIRSNEAFSSPHLSVSKI
jgi:hypothetical protein